MINNIIQEKLRQCYNPEGSELRYLQEEMLNLLKIIIDICSKHSIPFWIDGGTLLGAVRHGGFIPWDDDLDIGMLRTDYKKLKVILKNELKYPYILQNNKTDKGYILPFSKLRNENIIVNEIKNRDLYYRFKGVFIDIFTFDYNWYFLNRISSRLTAFFRPNGNRRAKTQFTLNYIGHYVMPIVNVFFRLINKIKKSPYLTYDYGVAWPIKLKYDDIFPLKIMEFEGIKVSVPNKYKKYLYQAYGDYMSLPPEEQRRTHLRKN